MNHPPLRCTRYVGAAALCNKPAGYTLRLFESINTEEFICQECVEELLQVGYGVTGNRWELDSLPVPAENPPSHDLMLTRFRRPT